MDAPDRDWNLLLHRYLEGTIGPEEGTIFNSRLKEDPMLARRLAEMSVDALQLRDLGAGEALEPLQGEAASPPRASWPKGPIAAAAAILLAVLVAVFSRSFQEAGQGTTSESATSKPSQPEGDSWVAAVDGFEGFVMGRVVKRDGRKIRLRIEEVLQSNERPRAPEVLAGRQVRLMPGMVRGDEGERPDPLHQSFLRRLQNGEELKIEIAHEKTGVFRILRLDRYQAHWAKSGREGGREGDEEREQEPGERRRGKDREEEGPEEERQFRREGDQNERGEKSENRRREREQGDRKGREERPSREDR